jgi:hypothetical protein
VRLQPIFTGEMAQFFHKLKQFMQGEVHDPSLSSHEKHQETG